MKRAEMPTHLLSFTSHYNALEFCQGTFAEMGSGDVYEAIDKYSNSAWFPLISREPLNCGGCAGSSGKNGETRRVPCHYTSAITS